MEKVAIMIAALTVVIIGGVIVMRKRVLKEDIVDLNGINNITLSSPRADVYLYTSSGKELKVVQYSRNKVEEEKKFHSSISGDDLNISNNIDDVMAGISYEILKLIDLR